VTALFLAAVSLPVALVAFATERIFGWPDGLHRRIGHPVTWIGAAIGRLDATLNRDGDSDERRRVLGFAALAAVLALVGVITVYLCLWLRSLPGGFLIEGVLAAPLLATKSLRDHVLAVANGFDRGLDQARDAVRHIIGRDPQTLDASGIAKGAIESLAENASDGVIAPLFWLMVFGLPGVALYKTINTADSMIGYRSDRHRGFGWAAARLDDLVNLPAARLTALLVAAAAGLRAPAQAKRALVAARRDAPEHVSPNAGWPEAAMAGALGIALGGPRTYGGRKVDLAVMGRDGRAPVAEDIGRAVALFDMAMALVVCGLFLAVLAAAIL